jgi:hypothetical protein
MVVFEKINRQLQFKDNSRIRNQYNNGDGAGKAKGSGSGSNNPFSDPQQPSSSTSSATAGALKPSLPTITNSKRTIS